MQDQKGHGRQVRMSICISDLFLDTHQWTVLLDVECVGNNIPEYQDYSELVIDFGVWLHVWKRVRHNTTALIL